MKLIKIGLINGLAVIVKIAGALLLNKIIAYYVGSNGYAIIGQFQTVVNTLITIVNGTIGNGVTKYTAEYYDRPKKQIILWQTAGTISITGALAIGLLLWIFNNQLARILLKSEEMSTAFNWLAMSLLIIVFNGLILAILSGKKEVGKYIGINIFGTVSGFGIAAIITIKYGQNGAIIALSLYQSATIVGCVAICWKSSWFKLSNLIGRIDKEILDGLSKFALMTIIPTLCTAISQILIRNYVGEKFSWSYAGYWEALNRLSGVYISIVTAPIALYLLPKMSAIKKKSELLIEIIGAYKVILPTTILLSSGIYVLRNWIVLVLFSNEFTPMSALFAWQLIGDILKSVSFIMAYVIMAKGLFKQYIASEVIFSVVWLTMTVVFSNMVGADGPQIAYFLSYLTCWVVQSAMIAIWYRDNKNH